MLPVIVLGAGPVGLGAALELARCRIPSILIERKDTTSSQPSISYFNTRSMEIARGWGRKVYDELRELDLCAAQVTEMRAEPLQAGADVRSAESRTNAPAADAISSVRATMCTQDKIEQVLLRQAQCHNLVDVRFCQQMVAFIRGDDPEDEGVIIQVRNPSTGQLSIIHGAALVAADGAHSTMRAELNMPMHGAARLSHSIHCCFTASLGQVTRNSARIQLLNQHDHAAGVLQALQEKDQWLCRISVSEQDWSTHIFTPQWCAQWIREVVGQPDLAVQVHSVGKWQQNALLAEQLVVGNVVLLGDAAHMFTHAQGMGVNTGLHGMHNAMWKLALWLHGKAGRRLLDTYTTEHRALARWMADHWTQLLSPLGQTALNSQPNDAHTFLAQEPWESNPGHAYPIGLELGGLYESRAVCPDGSVPPQCMAPYREYIPTGRPGHRAPHVWLRHGDERLSTLDLWGPEFTVLAGAQGNAWASTVQAVAKQTHLDMQFHLIGGLGWSDEDNDFQTRYGLQADGAVLVRPDGYVAWRSSQWSEQAAQQLMTTLQRILS